MNNIPYCEHCGRQMQIGGKVLLSPDTTYDPLTGRKNQGHDTVICPSRWCRLRYCLDYAHHYISEDGTIRHYTTFWA